MSAFLNRGRFFMLALFVMLCLPCLALADYASKTVEMTVSEEAGETVPPVLAGRAFRLYQSGTRISLIKQQMQKLGYYKKMATFDDKFNESMRQRVLLFQRNNGLEENGWADEATIAALYSENPVKGTYYAGKDVEPQRALIIPVTKSAQWYLSAEDQYGVRIAVRNVSQKKTVQAFELSLYTLDAQGNRLHEFTSLVTTGRIAPESEMWSGYAYLDGTSEVQAVCAALTRVRFEDGTYEIYDAPAYDRWEMKETQAKK